ncbi:hypothetical protein BDQ12DRAFT_716348 [Crucibulum laeve]|uniref:Uncharacterized protein n=1 Tax=Crucibulum laeve TaxID=68775 RepID=A0A5C3LI97_9AGAR|nr:hypothetical protein BDQ12DRAFT_716348 [Crucibulum laeve]
MKAMSTDRGNFFYRPTSPPLRSSTKKHDLALKWGALDENELSNDLGTRITRRSRTATRVNVKNPRRKEAGHSVQGSSLSVDREADTSNVTDVQSINTLEEDEVLAQLASETQFESKVEAEGEFIVPKNRLIQPGARISFRTLLFQNITGKGNLNIDEFLPPLNAQVEAEQFREAVINSLNLQKDNYIHTSWGAGSSRLHPSITLGAVIIDEEGTNTGEPKETSDKEKPEDGGDPLGDKSGKDNEPTKPESPKVKEEEIDPDLDAKPKDKGKDVNPKEKGKRYKEFKEKDECEWESKKDPADRQPPRTYFTTTDFIRERSEIPGGGYFRARSDAPRGRERGPPSNTSSSSSSDESSGSDESGGGN